MSNKKNQSLIGIILVVLGIYILANRFLGFPLGAVSNMPVMLAGGALLLLYHTKQKNWALVTGSILLFVGVLGYLPSIPVLGAHLTGAMVFWIPGIIFMGLFLSKRIIGFLIPGSILLWFGTFLFMTAFPFPGGLEGAMFFAFIGMAFMTMYILGGSRIGRWPLIPGWILIGFGAFILAASSFSFLFKLLPILLPVILIGFGIMILLRNRKNQ